MENKPYERTQRSFNYTPASIFTNQWSNLAFGVGMIVIPAIFPFGLRIRHLRPEVEKGKVEYRSFLTTDIEYIKDDEEEHQCKVKTPDNYIIFEAKYFDSWEEFEAFRALLG